jgi:alkylresorcinol/alkylpyrone synthase
MSFILKSHSVFPENVYTQNYFEDFLATHWPDKKAAISQLSKNVCVEKRALCIDLHEVMKLSDFASRNKIWKEQSQKLVKQSIMELFETTSLTLQDVDMFITTSVTGFSIPSLDTLLMNQLEFKQGVKRLPLFGFGCLGGLSSLNRAHDFLQANPDKVVLISAVELCSLTFQAADFSIPNLVGTSLFGDGAASVLMVGRDHPMAKESKYELIDYEAFFYKETEDTMGWDIVNTGFKLILNKNVSDIVYKNIPENTKSLLSSHEVNVGDLKFSISHPGGPKVLIAMQESLGLDKKAFAKSWESLREHGNLSSVSILNVLERSLKENVGEKGEYGVMAAMGPGFNSEISLIKKVA